MQHCCDNNGYTVLFYIVNGNCCNKPKISVAQRNQSLFLTHAKSDVMMWVRALLTHLPWKAALFQVVTPSCLESIPESSACRKGA